MFNLTEKDIIGQTNKLLFNILEELKKMNKVKEYTQDIKPVNEVKQAQIMPKTEIEKKLCKHCGAHHENKGLELACARKYKKKEGT